MYYFVMALINAIYIILFLRVILSWFRVGAGNPFVRIIHEMTEPILSPIRLLIEKSIFGGRKGGMILDISPLIAFIFLQLLQNYITQIMLTYGN